MFFIFLYFYFKKKNNFAEIIGTPVHVTPELTNVYVLRKSTSFLLFNLLRLGRIRTSEKSNFISWSIRTILSDHCFLKIKQKKSKKSSLKVNLN